MVYIPNIFTRHFNQIEGIRFHELFKASLLNDICDRTRHNLRSMKQFCNNT